MYSFNGNSVKKILQKEDVYFKNLDNTNSFWYNNQALPKKGVLLRSLKIEQQRRKKKKAPNNSFEEKRNN